ncbi:HUP3, partial [Symbiodinium pilosum]
VHHADPRLEHVHYRLLRSNGSNGGAASDSQFHPSLPVPDHGTADRRSHSGVEFAGDQGCRAHRGPEWPSDGEGHSILRRGRNVRAGRGRV